MACEISPQSVHRGGYAAQKSFKMANPKVQQLSLFGKESPHRGKPLD